MAEHKYRELSDTFETELGIIQLRAWANRILNELILAAKIKINDGVSVVVQAKKFFDKDFTIPEGTAIMEIIQNWLDGYQTIPFEAEKRGTRAAIGLLCRELAKQINEGTETPKFITEVENALKKLRTIPLTKSAA